MEAGGLQMKSIVIASVPVHGHVTPLLSVARHFVERGDSVRFLTGRRFAEAVHATGATHIALPDDADFDDRIGLNERFPERASLKGARAVSFDLQNVFVSPATSQCEAVMAAHATAPADVVLTDPAFTGSVILLGYPRPLRPPVVNCGVLPLGVNSRDTAPFGIGLPPARWLNRPRNAALAVLGRRIFDVVDKSGDELHRAVHGRGLPFSMFDWAAHAEAIVQFTVPQFEYPRSDGPSNLHFAGPLSATGSTAPLPDWWADLDGARPVVHVTQGTVANKDYNQLIAPTLHALADEDVLVVVTTGGRPVDTLPALPANARAASYLPYDELLPRTAVYVTNGGYGGVQYALRYGVPIVATGGQEDKPEVGARVAWSGVGRRIRSDRPSPRKLRRRILEVLNDPRFRQASRRMSEHMRASDGYGVLTRVVDDVCGSSPAAGTDSLKPLSS